MKYVFLCESFEYFWVLLILVYFNSFWQSIRAIENRESIIDKNHKYFEYINNII